jgi:hypothetical protein
MILAQPPIYDEFLGDGAHPSTDCGEACVMSIVELFTGQKQDEAATEGAIGACINGTSETQLAAFLASHGVTTAIHNATIAQAGQAAISAGHMYIALIQSNSAANPVPAGSTAIAHWVLIYGDNNGSPGWNLMNPNGNYQTDVLDAADLSLGIEILGYSGGNMESIVWNKETGDQYVWDKDGLRHIEPPESDQRQKLGQQLVPFTTAQLAGVKIWPTDAGSLAEVVGPKGDKGDPGNPGKDSVVPGPKGDPGKDSVIPGPKGDKGDAGAAVVRLTPLAALFFKWRL